MFRISRLTPPGGGSRYRLGLRLLAPVMAGIMALAAPGTAQTAANKGIFNSTEKRSDNLRPFPKWTQVLERYIEERKNVPGTCAESIFNKCHYQRWQQLIASLQGRSVKSQLKAVNNYANAARYILDPINWGVKDYWASPGQFFRKNGDCEDYAILKFLTLRRLGWQGDSLRIVVLQDLDLRIAHAILAVYDKKKIFILDNQMTLVVEDRRIRHYRPIFSLNEWGWWRHRAGKRG
jgi:predicted transglutaminase-like cysteine proteinase